jgi:N-acetyl-anhydromuramyl-L-alanine amidase AmpD
MAKTAHTLYIERTAVTAAQYAPAVKQAGIDAGITPKGIVIAFATCFVESDWLMYANSRVTASMSLPHDAVGSDGYSVGLFQQQVVDSGNGWWWGDAATCMDPYKSAALFYGRLAKLDYNTTTLTAGGWAQTVQQSAFPDRYDERIADAQALYNSLAGTSYTPPEAPVTDPNKPDYNEFPIWSSSSQDRAGTKVDLFLLHTQEGGGGDSAAEDLANYLANPANQVSYHYTISQASDGGVTLVDCVDTDEAAWAVGDANARSINLCFAGSSASWTRDQWMAQSHAIDSAAYVAVQDCKKYSISTLVVPPPYTGTPGISDHMYVTDVLKWGTHTDVGPNFPWDVFTAAVAKYTGLDTEQPPPPPPVVVVPPPVDAPASGSPTLVGPADDQVSSRWEMLGGQTLVEAVAEIRDKLLGTNDRQKTGTL